jgi:hypothetical protein
MSRGTPTGPDRDIEALLREMLNRRAADIPADTTAGDGLAPRPLPTGAPAPVIPLTTAQPALGRRGGIWAAAAVLLVLAGGVAVGLRAWLDDGADAGPQPAARVETGDVDDTSDGASGDQPGADSPGSGPADDGPAIEVADIISRLPPGVDPLNGSTLWLPEVSINDPEVAATDYLALRLPGLPVTVDLVSQTETLYAFSWEIEPDDSQDLQELGGFILVRADPDRVGVVAATTDGVTVETVQRTTTGLAASVRDDRHDLADLYADVTDLVGALVVDPEAAPPLPGSPTDPVFGTAGWTSSTNPEAETLALEISGEYPNLPLALRLQHVGGTWLTITEFVVDPVEATPCGDEPPVTIAVGDRLGPLTTGPTAGSPIDPLPGQGVWHHPGTADSLATAVEIRWPPDHSITGRLGVDGFGPPSSDGSTPSLQLASSPGAWQSVVTLDPGVDRSDPCGLVQFTVIGDPEIAKWWSGALAAMWSFGVPLDLGSPDLDPIYGIDPDGGLADADDGETSLVIGTVVAEPPVLPAEGTCDGAPLAPPERGQPGVTGASAEAALEAFVSAQGAIDPPLPTGGYARYEQADSDTVTFVIADADGPLVVITVERTGTGTGDGDGDEWTVTQWEVAAC